MPKLGDCYPANGRKILDMKKSARLCHGFARLQIPPYKLFGHAWIEDGNTVYDYSNGKNIKIDKDMYYALGQIQNKNVKRYTAEESAIKMVTLKNWGPWK